VANVAVNVLRGEILRKFSCEEEYTITILAISGESTAWIYYQERPVSNAPDAKELLIKERWNEESNSWLKQQLSQPERLNTYCMVDFRSFHNVTKHQANILTGHGMVLECNSLDVVAMQRFAEFSAKFHGHLSDPPVTHTRIGLEVWRLPNESPIRPIQKLTHITVTMRSRLLRYLIIA